MARVGLRLWGRGHLLHQSCGLISGTGDVGKALARNELSGAVEAIERAKRINPLPPEGSRIQHAIAAAFVDQGEIAFQQQDYATAYQHFRHAITVDPTDVWARHRLEDTRER